MKVTWSAKAEDAMHQIEYYILAKFGEDSRSQFMKEVERVAYLLEEMPDIGHPEPLLAHRPQGYRSITIHRLSKMVYYIHGDSIRIAAFWDTRREPKQQVIAI